MDFFLANLLSEESWVLTLILFIFSVSFTFFFFDAFFTICFCFEGGKRFIETISATVYTSFNRLAEIQKMYLFFLFCFAFFLF